MKKNCKITEAQLKKIVCEKKYKSEAKPYSGIIWILMRQAQSKSDT
jgi:hypothetical protein